MSAIASLLVRRQLEGKRLAVSPDQLARLPQSRRRLLLPLAGLSRAIPSWSRSSSSNASLCRPLSASSTVRGPSQATSASARVGSASRAFSPAGREVQVVAREPQRSGPRARASSAV